MKTQSAYMLAMGMPTVAAATFVLTPSQVVASCNPWECAYGEGCYSVNACVDTDCPPPGSKQVCVKGEPPLWTGCGVCH